MSAADEVLLSRRDLSFMLDEWLEVEDLTKSELYEDLSREDFHAAIDLAAEIAIEEFAPLSRLGDRHRFELQDGAVPHPPAMKHALKIAADTGVMTFGLDRSLGGGGLPATVATACSMWLQAANPSLWAYGGLGVATANLIQAHGSREQVEAYAVPMYESRFHGTMCLSEPDVGSSVGDLKTRAEPQGDGTYRLFGDKMWISAGEHDLGENIVHLVLARIKGAPDGTRGISLFLVPKVLNLPDGSLERNDVTVVGLNHKMGYRGIVNTVLNLGSGTTTPGGRAGAVAQLIGAENEGLAAMFHLMNEARLTIGGSATAIGYTGYLKSLTYARERVQGRAPDAPRQAAPVPIIEHADVRRMLLAQKSYVEGAMGLVLYAARLIDDDRVAAHEGQGRDARDLLSFLIPIVKSWPSQWCVAANDLAIQVLAGAGYTEDHDLEMHYRDNRLNPIHEGTHGIQAVDLLGRKVGMADGAGLNELRRRIERTVLDAAVSGPSRRAMADQLSARLDRFLAVTEVLVSCEDTKVRLANASLYLETAGHLVVAWLWLQQHLATGDLDDPFYRGKRSAAEYFFRYELPCVDPHLDLLESLDTLALTLDDASF